MNKKILSWGLTLIFLVSIINAAPYINRRDFDNTGHAFWNISNITFFPNCANGQGIVWVNGLGVCGAVGGYDLNISGDSGAGVITDSEVLSVVGTGSVTTSMSGNTLTIDGSVGGGGAGDKWIDDGTFISPNTTFAATVNASFLTENFAVNISGGNVTINDTVRAPRFSLGATLITSFEGNNLSITGGVLNWVGTLYNSWTIAGDSGTTPIRSGETMTIAGGTNITTTESAGTVTIAHSITTFSGDYGDLKNVPSNLSGTNCNGTACAIVAPTSISLNGSSIGDWSHVNTTTAGTNISVTGNNIVNLAATLFEDWNLGADSGGPLRVLDAATATIAGGTNLSTAISGSTLTISHAIATFSGQYSDLKGVPANLSGTNCNGTTCAIIASPTISLGGETISSWADVNQSVGAATTNCNGTDCAIQATPTLSLVGESITSWDDVNTSTAGTNISVAGKNIISLSATLFEDWNLGADSGGPLRVIDGATATIAGGTNLSTAISGSTLTISHAIATFSGQYGDLKGVPSNISGTNCNGTTCAIVASPTISLGGETISSWANVNTTTAGTNISVVGSVINWIGASFNGVFKGSYDMNNSGAAIRTPNSSCIWMNANGTTLKIGAC